MRLSAHAETVSSGMDSGTVLGAAYVPKASIRICWCASGAQIIHIRQMEWPDWNLVRVTWGLPVKLTVLVQHVLLDNTKISLVPDHAFNVLKTVLLWRPVQPELQSAFVQQDTLEHRRQAAQNVPTENTAWEETSNAHGVKPVLQTQ
jgi:hypothetical protein